MLNTKCPECGGLLRIEKEEVYCRKCGLVVDDSPINFDKVFFDPEKRKKRGYGEPITYLNPF